MPESFISFLESADFGGAVRNAVSPGGDADTMACIAGDIAQAYFGAVPEPIAGEVGRACRTDSWTCSTASSLGSFAGSDQTLLVSGFARARCADRGPDFLVALSCEGWGVRTLVRRARRGLGGKPRTVIYGCPGILNNGRLNGDPIFFVHIFDPIFSQLPRASAGLMAGIGWKKT